MTVGSTCVVNDIEHALRVWEDEYEDEPLDTISPLLQPRERAHLFAALLAVLHGE